MIARVWNGRTDISDFESYTFFLKSVAVPDYKKTPGFRGLLFLRNHNDHQAFFKLITYWEDIPAIVAFAGSDYRKAKYYSEDKNFLLEFVEEVEHYEVFEKFETEQTWQDVIPW
jgi:heme-degrading monooxygenase HmoA